MAGGAVKTPTDQYLAHFESNTLKDKLIETYKLRDRYKAKYQQQARDSLKSNSKITADKKSGLIQIEVIDKDPKFAAELANAYVEELSQMIGIMSLKEAKAKRELLERQITQAMNKSYQSPMVRELIIQTLLRDYETTRLEGKKGIHFWLEQMKLKFQSSALSPKNSYFTCCNFGGCVFDGSVDIKL